MKKIALILSVLTVVSCASSEEREFQNRQYMFGDGTNVVNAQQTQAHVVKEEKTTTVWEYLFGSSDSAPVEVVEQKTTTTSFWDYLWGPRETAEHEYVERSPVTMVKAEDLPRYEVVERRADVQNIHPEPFVAHDVIAQKEVVVYDSVPNPVPQKVKHAAQIPVEKNRQYKKYKDAYIVETPQGTINLWEETLTPEVYEVVAARTVNKMLKETGFIYDKIPVPSMYITDIMSNDGTIDNGFYYSRKVTKDILVGSKTFKMVNNISQADYYVEINVNSVELNGGMDYAIQYNLRLLDSNNTLIKQWSEVIKKVQNEGSWW